MKKEEGSPLLKAMMTGPTRGRISLTSVSLSRDTFLYMEPKDGDPEAKDFAQCDCCLHWTGDGSNRCAFLGRSIEVTEDMSCCLFIRGEPHEQPVEELATPEEVGLVDRQVRCENCASFDGRGTCLFFAGLNREMPETFKLDAKVEAQGCCNAQTPKRK